MATDVLARLSVLIDAQTKQFGVALNGLNTQLNKFGTTVNAQAKSISNFEKRIAGIQRTLGTLGIAFGTREIISFASEAAKLAGQFEGVNNAFQKLPNSQKVLADLKEATQGTVSELELMRRTVQATNFGISLEQLPRLLEFAAVRAQQTGESVDYLVNSIVTGIGRKSPLILDNLGISAARLKEEFGGAALEAQSIADVTAAVGRIASEELTKMGRLTEDTAVTMQQVAAAWENFKVSVGDGIVGDIFDKLAKDALTILRAFGPAAEQAKNWTETLARAIADPLARRSGGPSTAVLDDITERLKVLRKEAGAPITFNIEQISERFKFTEQEIAIFLQRMEEVNKQLSLSERVMNQVTESANSSFDGDLSAAAAAQVKVLSDELVTLEERLAKAAEQNQSAFAIEALNRQIAVRRESLAILNQYIAGLDKENKGLNDQLGIIEDLEKKIKDYGQEMKKAHSITEIRRLQHELERVQIQLDKVIKGPSTPPKPIKMPIEFAPPESLDVTEDEGRKLLDAIQGIIPVEGLVIPIRPKIDPTQLHEESTGEAVKEKLNEIGQAATQNALAINDALASVIESAISGQQNFAAALGAVTLDVLEQFQRQALGAALAAYFSSPTPKPFPLLLLGAGLAIAAVKSLFRRATGGGGGGGGSAGGGSITQARVAESARQSAIRVEFGTTEFRFNGKELVAAIKQEEFEKGLRG